MDISHIHDTYRHFEFNQIKLSADLSWWEHEKKPKDFRRPSDFNQWKTHVELLKKAINGVITSSDASNKAFGQPTGKAIRAVAKLLTEFCRWNPK